MNPTPERDDADAPERSPTEQSARDGGVRFTSRCRRRPRLRPRAQACGTRGKASVERGVGRGQSGGVPSYSDGGSACPRSRLRVTTKDKPMESTYSTQSGTAMSS